MLLISPVISSLLACYRSVQHFMAGGVLSTCGDIHQIFVHEAEWGITGLLFTIQLFFPALCIYELACQT